jgi:hypothetical protein
MNSSSRTIQCGAKSSPSDSEAQFRAEFFNFFNWANFAIPAALSAGVDPSANSQFGCACATPDVQGNNPVLGSGGPRHIQFGLKLSF